MDDMVDTCDRTNCVCALADMLTPMILDRPDSVVTQFDVEVKFPWLKVLYVLLLPAPMETMVEVRIVVVPDNVL
jgi:hypothetical protein